MARRGCGALHKQRWTSKRKRQAVCRIDGRRAMSAGCHQLTVRALPRRTPGAQGYGREARDGCLPVIRCLADARPASKPWCDIDCVAFYLFACAAGPPGKKGDATKSGRPHGFAPSLIMLRNHPRLPPSAIFKASLALESYSNGNSVTAAIWSRAYSE